MDDRLQLRGGGKGGFGTVITTGCPMVDPDNWARVRCCFLDGGCQKLDLICQTLCFKCLCVSRRPTFAMTTAMPLAHDDNWGRVRCCCVDGGCLRFAPHCQLLCLKCWF
eukprot:TRINITY_DN11256_c0_g1_i10.p1 TRINITY_DN11256_c0_g1~~TRINITY_DN11256_c0_g1_i10.p1  ORF type:complete len:109 (-),score=3.15 TRINITY_DN11256_c0_g1_i10:167-493(-)